MSHSQKSAYRAKVISVVQLKATTADSDFLGKLEPMSLCELREQAKRLFGFVVLNDFLDSREELTASRSEIGTTCFPRLEKGSVDSLWTLLNDKYETAFVPGRFFESPQHLRIGMCAEPQLFETGIQRLGQALDELSA